VLPACRELPEMRSKVITLLKEVTTDLDGLPQALG
jgi:hypothetical protein